MDGYALVYGFAAMGAIAAWERRRRRLQARAKLTNQAVSGSLTATAVILDEKG